MAKSVNNIITHGA